MVSISVRGVNSSSDPFLIFSLPKIYPEQLKLETSNFVCWFAMWSINLRIDK